MGKRVVMDVRTRKTRYSKPDDFGIVPDIVVVNVFDELREIKKRLELLESKVG